MSYDSLMLRAAPLLLAALLAASPVLAQQARPGAKPPSPPQEEVLEFETVHSYALNLNELGSGWGLVSIYPRSYEVGLEAAPELKGAEVAFIKALPGGNYAQGDLMQSVATDALAGRRIRWMTRIRNQGDGFAVFWVNVFAGDGRLINNVHRKLELNTGWEPLEIVMDVPANTMRLEIGASLQGREGSGIWIDSVALEVSGNRR